MQESLQVRGMLLDQSALLCLNEVYLLQLFHVPLVPFILLPVPLRAVLLQLHLPQTLDFPRMLGLLLLPLFDRHLLDLLLLGKLLKKNPPELLGQIGFLLLLLVPCLLGIFVSLDQDCLEVVLLLRLLSLFSLMTLLFLQSVIVLQHSLVLLDLPLLILVILLHL